MIYKVTPYDEKVQNECYYTHDERIKLINEKARPVENKQVTKPCYYGLIVNVKKLTQQLLLIW